MATTKNRYAFPWWRWLNPWLYIIRRDRAYSDALDIIEEQGKALYNLSLRQHGELGR